MAEGLFKQGNFPRRILVVKPSSLGDVVHSLPFLDALKRRFPGAEIDWVIARGLEGLLEGHPMINRLIVIDKDRWRRLSQAGKTVRELRELTARLKEAGYDLAVDLQGLLRSGLITAASGALVRVGFEEAREGSRLFYTHRVRGGRDIHAVQRYLRVAEFLGCDISGAGFPMILPSEASDAVKKLAASNEDYAVLVAGARWDTKIWPAERFGSLAGMLDMKSIVVGGMADVGRASEIVRLSGGKAASAAGMTTLPELITLIRGAAVVVTNDSGPMHIAAALGVPVIAIFGPTSAKKTGPYATPHFVIQSSRSCVPCLKRKCATTACMTDITPEMVLKKIKELGVSC